MRKRMAAGMLAALVAVASMICFSNRVAAEQADMPEQATQEEAQPKDVWTDSQRKMIVALHWLTKPDVGMQAVKVPLTQTASSDNVMYTRPLDGKDNTYSAMEQDTTLRYESETGFDRIYVKLEHSCQWTVTLPDGTVQEGGKDGFIHELMELGQSVTSFDLNLPQGVGLCDIHVFTAGKLPSWVQIWEPPCENADFLVLPTHADDEHLWFGGVMPYYAGELGYKVQVVYMTNHFNQNVRSHELLNGLWTVGVRHYPIISERFDDIYATKASVTAAAEIFGRENVLEFQVEMLRRFSPKIVIAHDIHGEYGHGAHILNAQTVLEALPLTDDASVFPESAEKYGTCKVQKCYLHLWQERPIVMEWRNMPLARFDDVSALEMAVNGFHCHVSQLRWSFHVADSGRLDCRKFGLAYTTVGDDTPDKNDILEHVVWTDNVPKADTASADSRDSDSSGNLSVKNEDVSSIGQVTTGQERADQNPTVQEVNGQMRTPDLHNERTVRLIAFLALAFSGVICAVTATVVYSKKQ